MSDVVTSTSKQDKLRLSTEVRWFVICLGAGLLALLWIFNPRLFQAIDQLDVRLFAPVEHLSLLVGVYLIPTIVAHGRKHNQRNAITALNILLGWTGLGWVGAFVWALTNERVVSTEGRPR
jgi:hypothetical protein